MAYFGKGKKTMLTDSQILDAMRQGGRLQEDTISYLLEAYQGLFYKGKRRYGLEEDMARDAYTDAFLALRQQLVSGKFQGNSQVSTYFYQIFCNKCADQKRKSQTHILNQPLEMALDIPLAAQNAFQELVQKEDFERLKKLMSKLKENCRKLLWESDYLGFSAGEIAERMGLKDAKSVKSQKYRCLQRLRKIWRVEN